MISVALERSQAYIPPTKLSFTLQEDIIHSGVMHGRQSTVSTIVEGEKKKKKKKEKERASNFYTGFVFGPLPLNK